MILKILLLFLVCLLVSCQSPGSLVPEISYPICIDNVNFDSKVLEYDDYNQMLKGHILYIGKEKDTIYIDYQPPFYIGIPPPPPPQDFLQTVTVQKDTMKDSLTKKLTTLKPKWDSCRCYMADCNSQYASVLIGDTVDLRVVVDTNRHLLSYNYLAIKRQAFKAYPVIIKNLEEDTIVFATQYSIPLVLEGYMGKKWEELKEPYQYRGCGMGAIYWLLPPNEIAVTTIPIYQWKTQRKLRIKLGQNYSSTFTGYIHPS